MRVQKAAGETWADKPSLPLQEVGASGQEQGPRAGARLSHLLQPVASEKRGVGVTPLPQPKDLPARPRTHPEGTGTG